MINSKLEIYCLGSCIIILFKIIKIKNKRRFLNSSYKKLIFKMINITKGKIITPCGNIVKYNFKNITTIKKNQFTVTQNQSEIQYIMLCMKLTLL